MKNILVTGGAGFIGSNFVRYMLEKDFNIVTLDALKYAGSMNNLKDLPNPDNHIFIYGDIGDDELVKKVLLTLDIDTIVNFAAETHVDRSINSPDPFMYSNVMGTFTLLETLRKINKDIRFHQISTDEVFGSLNFYEPAWEEDAPYKPNSPYSASKAAADHLVRAYGNTYGIQYTISHSSNNYGPRQYPEKLIPLCITNALKGLPIPVYGDGEQIRDWVYVLDHCEGIYNILEKGHLGHSYNLGGNNQSTNIAMIKRICSLLDDILPAPLPYSSLITFVGDRAGHDRRYALDNYKAYRTFGWTPEYDLDEGLYDTIKWCLEVTE